MDLYYLLVHLQCFQKMQLNWKQIKIHQPALLALGFCM